MLYSQIFQINYQYMNASNHCLNDRNYRKHNKISRAIKVSTYSMLAAIVSQFLVWGIEYAVFKGLTNEEREELEIYDYITTVIIASLNGFISVFLSRNAFLFVASINAVVISNLLYIYFHGEKENFNLVAELIVTILTVIIIFKIVIRLFDNIPIVKNKDSIGYLIFLNIILNFALSVDFSIYNLIFNQNAQRSQIAINESVDI